MVLSSPAAHESRPATVRTSGALFEIGTGAQDCSGIIDSLRPWPTTELRESSRRDVSAVMLDFVVDESVNPVGAFNGHGRDLRNGSARLPSVGTEARFATLASVDLGPLNAVSLARRSISLFSLPGFHAGNGNGNQPRRDFHEGVSPPVYTGGGNHPPRGNLISSTFPYFQAERSTGNLTRKHHHPPRIALARPSCRCPVRTPRCSSMVGVTSAPPAPLLLAPFG